MSGPNPLKSAPSSHQQAVKTLQVQTLRPLLPLAVALKSVKAPENQMTRTTVVQLCHLKGFHKAEIPLLLVNLSLQTMNIFRLCKVIRKAIKMILAVAPRQTQIALVLPISKMFQPRLHLTINRTTAPLFNK
jgi:hypothetical protein